jgi:DNA-binding XRE family transcriptional regulator
MVKHDSVLNSLGRNLRQARESKSLTQEKLAELAGLDPTYISGIKHSCGILALWSLNHLI